MRVRFKKPLIVLGGAGAVGGAGYYAFSRWSGVETVAVPKVIIGPRWFNKLKKNESNKLSYGMQSARSWAKEGYQQVAENWIDLICKEEKSENESDREFCEKEK